MASFTGTAGNDDITGTDDSDFIDISQGGNDTVHALGGDDTVYIGDALSKRDHIDGGDGYDTLVLAGDYSHSTKLAAKISGFEQITLTAGGTYHLMLGKGLVAAGGTLTVDATALHADGSLDIDATGVNHGTVVLEGSDSNDHLVARVGDTIMGGDGVDDISFASGFGSPADYDFGYLDAGAGNDFVAIGNATIHEGELNGGAGIDALDYGVLVLDMAVFNAASSGFEEIGPQSGGMFIGNDGANNFDFSTFASPGDLAVSGAGGDDILTGTDKVDVLGGDDGNDVLTGGDGGDYIDGGTGNDMLIGGSGNDSLTGGTGADRFVYDAVSDSPVKALMRDVITDFSHADGDLIDLSAIDADTTLAGDQAFHLVSHGFTGTAGELIQGHDHGVFVIEGDVDGDGQADFAIAMDNGSTLAVSDFVL